MSKNENPNSDNYQAEEPVPSDNTDSMTFGSGSAYSSAGTTTEAEKPRKFFTLERVLAALALLISLALFGVIAASVDVPSLATKNSNETILKGIKGNGTPVEIVDVVYEGNTSYTPIDEVIVRFEEEGQLTPCNVTMAKDGDTPKTFVECSGAVLTIDE